MASPRDERLKDHRALRKRARLQPENFASFLGPDQRRHFFKDGRDLLAQRVIQFWAGLDEPLAF